MVSLRVGEIMRTHDQRIIRSPCSDGVPATDRSGRQDAPQAGENAASAKARNRMTAKSGEADAQNAHFERLLPAGTSTPASRPSSNPSPQGTLKIAGKTDLCQRTEMPAMGREPTRSKHEHMLHTASDNILKSLPNHHHPSSGPRTGAQPLWQCARAFGDLLGAARFRNGPELQNIRTRIELHHPALCDYRHPAALACFGPGVRTFTQSGHGSARACHQPPGDARPRSPRRDGRRYLAPEWARRGATSEETRRRDPPDRGTGTDGRKAWTRPECGPPHCPRLHAAVPFTPWNDL